jgi:RecA-family ATPase
MNRPLLSERLDRFLERMKQQRRQDLIPDLLPERGKGAIVGPEGIGKTLVMMGIARAAAEGPPSTCLGLEFTRQLRPLLVQAEVAPVKAAERLERIFAGAEPSALEQVCVVNTADLRLPAEMDRLLDAVEAHGADLVQIDPRSSYQEGSENDDWAVRTFLAGLDQMIEQTGVAIII